jgi:hypothetical protein
MRYLLAATLLLLPPAFGQTAKPDSSPQVLINQALERFSANKKEAYAYTYIELWRNQNFSKHGRLKTDENAKFESVFIDDLPYLRKIEENGKPLTCNAARKEEEKYDAAVKERKGMTLEQKQAEMQVKNFTFPVDLNLLPELYNSRIVGTEVLNGRPAIHIDCVPRIGIAAKNEKESDALRVHLQVWIDEEDITFSRFDARLLESVNDLMPGSEASVSYTAVNGVWLPLRTIVRGQAKHAKAPCFRTEVSYSDFKKFRVDVRVLDRNNEAIPIGN